MNSLINSTVEVDNLTIKQGEKILWQNLSFCLKSGDRLGIFAPSGYGKSTLGRVIAQWQKISSGKILLDGQQISTKGYCPIQLVNQHPERSFNPYRTMRASVYDTWAPDTGWLNKLFIKPAWLARKPSELSGGELARIALLRALDPRTKFLIIDEATAQLDAYIQAKIWQMLIDESNQRPLGMLIFSHNESLLQKVCTNIIYFDDQC
ncbi:ATP-binding cassette domain-containing protein [Orbus sturtevantii]|uniref:ATP-binding cassette domain-containing protein n=1 Tax=Orbus sturtevantii TaxID=3074109 RepID=UPI00370D4982